jgi:transposase-like protein
MQVGEQQIESRFSGFQHFAVLPDVSQKPDTNEPKLPEMPIDELRRAIRKNQVSFPAQVPAFPKRDRPDLQQKLAQLYFVLGWSCPRIAKRYGLSRLRVQQILKAWKARAVEVGYIQTVPPPEILPLPPTDSPIQAVVLSIVKSSFPPVPAPTPPNESTGGQVPGRDKTPSGYRPRRRFDVARITSVLNELEAGRTVAEMANELGVSVCTIHAWRRHHEKYLLKRENSLLKEQLAKLTSVQTKLIDLITRSDKSQHRTFMPFLRISPHTESDYRESL